MYQFFKALEHLHSRSICHRDIKPHNLLINDTTGAVKLCDFGCSKRLIDGEPNIQYICARYYRAPEIVFGWPNYSCAIDLWSAGCVMAELFTGRPVFAGKNSIDQLARIVKVLGPPTAEDLAAMGQTGRKFKVSSSGGVVKGKELASILPADCPITATDLIEKLLRYNPEKRLKPSEALRHAFFRDIFAETCKLPSGEAINRTELDVPLLTESNNDVQSNERNLLQPS